MNPNDEVKVSCGSTPPYYVLYRDEKVFATTTVQACVCWADGFREGLTAGYDRANEQHR